MNTKESNTRTLYGIEYVVDGVLCALGPVFDSLEAAEFECSLLAADPDLTLIRPYRIH